jgi:hypothetical protein
MIQVDGLVNGTVYYGVVEAVDGQNASPSSAEFQVKPDIPAPGKLIAIPGNQKARFQFAPVKRRCRLFGTNGFWFTE